MVIIKFCNLSISRVQPFPHHSIIYRHLESGIFQATCSLIKIASDTSPHCVIVLHSCIPTHSSAKRFVALQSAMYADTILRICHRPACRHLGEVFKTILQWEQQQEQESLISDDQVKRSCLSWWLATLISLTKASARKRLIVLCSLSAMDEKNVVYIPALYKSGSLV